MFKEYLNKNCYVSVSLNGMDATAIFYHGLVSVVNDDVIVLENASICYNGAMLNKRKHMGVGKLAINKKYVIYVADEI